MAERKGPFCGGRLRHREGTCTQPAGKGTSHLGFGKCSWHGGCAPSGVKASEAQRAESEARSLLTGIGEFDPVTDPVAELQRLAGRAVRWLEVLESIVTDLHRIRYTTESEQIDGRIVVFERAMDRCSSILTGLAKLNLDERSVRVQEAQVAIVGDALRQALSEAQLPETERSAIVVRVAELVTLAGEQQAALPAGRRRPAA